MNFRHTYPRNKLFARLSGICMNNNQTPDSGGNPGDGGGGEGGGAGAPGPESLPNGGGQVQQNADHSAFNTPSPSPGHADRVREIMNRSDETHLTMDEIADLVRFDAPFKTPAAAIVPAQVAPPPAPPTPPAAPPAPPPVSADAKAIIDALKAAGVATPQNPQQPAPNTPPAPPQSYYGGEVPAVRITPQVLSGILGTDDPAILATAGPAVDSLVNGILNKAHADTNARMEAMARGLLSMIPQQVQQVNQVSQAETEFYNGFPELKTPAMRPLVNEISSLYVTAMRKTNPNFTWTPEARAQCGELIHRDFERRYGFKIPRGQRAVISNAPPAAPAQPAPTPAPAAHQPPYIARGGARPPAVSTPANQSADLMAFVI